ncbi:MAG: hypothetical protein M1434_11175 [Chloroflexi bacterium]|nr:hypothetical protein [Chloroflexota bacterium]MCL5275285.1 hypothetical protein [Chloroflexota bacterium]
MHLVNIHKQLLLAMASQGFLKAHRDIEGKKVYILHPLEGGEEIIPSTAVEYLVEHGLIDSNKKFPAATFWLTEKGKQFVAQLHGNDRLITQ